MELTCTIMSDAELPALYARMKVERLLWSLWPQYPEEWWSQEKFVALTGYAASLVLGVAVDGEPGGFLHLWPYCGSAYTRVGEVGVCAFRSHFRVAPAMCRAAMRWVFEHQDCSCLIGHIPDPNRHALRMLESVGFRKVCRVPGMGYYAKKRSFVDGVLVMATPDAVSEV